MGTTEALTYPDNNPKTAIGVTKVPLHLVPPSAKHYLAEALADGAKKYTPYNWRRAAISSSVYVAAMQRHIDAYWDGEDKAADSGVHHLAHAMACCALLLDAMSIGKLHDDRPPKGESPALHLRYFGEHCPVTVPPRRAATPSSRGDLGALIDAGMVELSPEGE